MGCTNTKADSRSLNSIEGFNDNSEILPTMSIFILGADGIGKTALVDSYIESHLPPPAQLQAQPHPAAGHAQSQSKKLLTSAAPLSIGGSAAGSSKVSPGGSRSSTMTTTHSPRKSPRGNGVSSMTKPVDTTTNQLQSSSTLNQDKGGSRDQLKSMVLNEPRKMNISLFEPSFEFIAGSCRTASGIIFSYDCHDKSTLKALSHQIIPLAMKDSHHWIPKAIVGLKADLGDIVTDEDIQQLIETVNNNLLITTNRKAPLSNEDLITIKLSTKDDPEKVEELFSQLIKKWLAR